MTENVTTLKVFSGGGQNIQATSGELCERIKGLVYEYAERLPVSAVIGVIEIAKFEIYEEQKQT